MQGTSFILWPVSAWKRELFISFISNALCSAFSFSLLPLIIAIYPREYAGSLPALFAAVSLPPASFCVFNCRHPREEIASTILHTARRDDSVVPETGVTGRRRPDEKCAPHCNDTWRTRSTRKHVDFQRGGKYAGGRVRHGSTET